MSRWQLACAALLVASADALTLPGAAVAPRPALRSRSSRPVALFGFGAAAVPVVVAPPTATATLIASVTGVLSGGMAIPAATSIAAVAGALAYIHQAYIFSLSYGLAMLGIGGAVLLTSPASLLLRVHAGLVA